jgi:DNA repair exonuclease SbcCD nuclease subunit
MTMVKTRGVTQLGEKGNGCQSFGGEEVYGAPWGATLSKFSTIRSSCPKATRNAIPVPRQILVAHVSTWDAPYAPGQEPGDALRLLNSLRGFDLVLTGDNHATFVIESNGRLLVNPGSVMRMESSQKGHRPVVFLYSAQHNAVEPVFLPIDPAAVIDDKLVARKSKESRRNLFVERLDGSAEIGLSFRHNINTHLTKHNTRPAVQSIVLECIGE